MAAIFDGLTEVWRRTGLVHRVLLLSILVGCVGAASGLVYWASRPTYSLLYSGLSTEDAAKVVEKARDDGIAYKLKDGGTTIYVASDKVYELRLTMASEGMPGREHKGYDLIEDMPIGSSPLMQSARLRQALEGELAKTIEALEMVGQAYVSIVPAGDTLFGGAKGKATASVTLKLKPGLFMTGQNVVAVQYLVARAVRGLSPEKVAVIDTSGRKLSPEDRGPLAIDGRTVLDVKMGVEQYYVTKIEGLLGPVVGPENVTVQVAATIDTTKMQKSERTYGEPVTKRELTKTSSVIPAGPVPAGQAPPAPQPIDDSSETEYYENPPELTTTTTIIPPGKVRSISVSVFVDLAAASTGDPEDTSAPTITAERLKAMVENAVKEDTLVPSVEVVDTRFYRDPAVAQAMEVQKELQDAGMFTKDFMLDMVKRGSLGILVIGVLLALKMLTARKPKVAPMVVESQPPAVTNLLAAAAGTGDRDAMRAQITRALQDNPDEVKRLFLTWVENEQGES